MQVASHPFRFEILQALEGPGCLFKDLIGLGRFQVADVLTQVNLMSHPDRYRVLEKGSDRQAGFDSLLDPDGERSITTSSPQDHLSVAHDAQDRIVHRT